MMTLADFELRKWLARFAKQSLIWIPLLIGLGHQFAMYFLGIDHIYVFLDPPEYICPFVSLEYQWWLVLLLISDVLAILIYSDRFQSIPRRVAFPFYLYILFLLILVKPI